MKILVTIYDMPNYGGIVPYIEQLIIGLKELGHRVDFIQLDVHTRISKHSKTTKVQIETDGTGLPWHLRYGWYGTPKINVNAIEDEWAADYDLVIHGIPCPGPNKQFFGSDGWVDVWERAGTKQICIVHDVNFPTRYPYLLYVKDHIEAAVCVHDAAYESTRALTDVPRLMIPNPFDTRGIEPGAPLQQRKQVLGAMAVWKPIKRIEKVIIPGCDLLDNGIALELVGEGIDRFKMASRVGRCPEEFKDENGEQYWDVALRKGMVWHGELSKDDAINWLKTVPFHIDTSKVGEGHAYWNRTTIECMLTGTVPVLHEEAVPENCTIFKPFDNYAMIPKGEDGDCWVADTVMDLFANSEWLIDDLIVERNHELAQSFDRKIIAERIVEFAFDPALGVKGEHDPIVAERADKHLEKFV